jgi:hypothetical protein
MHVWLLVAAAVQAASAASPRAGFNGMAPIEVIHVATARTMDLRLTQQYGPAAASPFMRGMIVQREVAPNAAVGIGLATMYSRRKAGFDPGSEGRTKRSRKPAVTFLLKF